MASKPSRSRTVFTYSSLVRRRSGAVPGTVAESEGSPAGGTGFIVVPPPPLPGFDPPLPGFDPPFPGFEGLDGLLGLEPPPGPFEGLLSPGMAPEQPRPQRATPMSPNFVSGRKIMKILPGRGQAAGAASCG